MGQRRFSQSHGTIRKGHGQSRINPSGLHFLHVITVPKVVFSFLFRQATGFFGNIGAPGQVGAFRFSSMVGQPPKSSSVGTGWVALLLVKTHFYVQGGFENWARVTFRT